MSLRIGISSIGIVFSGRGLANSNRSRISSFSASIRATMSRITGTSRSCSGRRDRRISGRPNTGERVLHLVRHDRRHLAESCKGFLFAQLGLGSLALGDIAPNRGVLIGLSALVQKRHNRRVHPIMRAVFRAVPQLAVPDAPARNGPPQIADELRGVELRIDDAVILSQQLLPGVLRDRAERVVDVRDPAVTSVVATMAAWSIACLRSERCLSCEVAISCSFLKRTTRTAVTQNVSVISGRLTYTAGFGCCRPPYGQINHRQQRCERRRGNRVGTRPDPKAQQDDGDVQHPHRRTKRQLQVDREDDEREDDGCEQEPAFAESDVHRRFRRRFRRRGHLFHCTNLPEHA